MLQMIVAVPVVVAAEQTSTWAAGLKPDSDQVAAAGTAAVACTAAAAAAMACADAVACIAAAEAPACTAAAEAAACTAEDCVAAAYTVNAVAAADGLLLLLLGQLGQSDLAHLIQQGFRPGQGRKWAAEGRANCLSGHLDA